MSALVHFDYLGTGKQTSAVAVGCWQLGGPHINRGRSIGWSDVDEVSLISAYRSLFDHGVNVFDTADSYGPEMLSARRLRLFLKGVPREEFFLCAKVGYHEGTKSLAWRHIGARLRSLLSVLDVTHCDLFSLHHNGTTDQDLDFAVDSLERVISEGLARAVAVRMGHVPTFASQAIDKGELFLRDLKLASLVKPSAALLCASDEVIHARPIDLPVIFNKVLSQGAYLGPRTQTPRLGDNRYGKVIFSRDQQFVVDQTKRAWDVDNGMILRFLLHRVISPNDFRLGFVGIRMIAHSEGLIGALREGPLIPDLRTHVAGCLDSVKAQLVSLRSDTINI
jgi:aryl-alcohol dehydrogenase-like predicted oxidoreductase